MPHYDLPREYIGGILETIEDGDIVQIRIDEFNYVSEWPYTIDGDFTISGAVVQDPNRRLPLGVAFALLYDGMRREDNGDMTIFRPSHETVTLRKPSPTP